MSKYIQTLKKNGRIDDPRYWAEDDVIRQPEFDLKGFQKKVDFICGQTRDRKSIVRVSWTWDISNYSVFYIDWDANGMPTKEHLRAKYVYKSVEVASDVTVDIPPPRFVFEELITPAQYYDSWEKNRWQFDKKRKVNVALRPPPPREGYYRFLFYVAAHDPNASCCRKAQKKGDECFGLFRLPGDVDLDRLAATRAIIETRPERPNPYQPFDTEVLDQIFEETEAHVKAEEERKQAEGEESRREFAEIIRPEVKYSLPLAPGEKRTPAGIITLGN